MEAAKVVDFHNVLFPQYDFFSVNIFANCVYQKKSRGIYFRELIALKYFWGIKFQKKKLKTPEKFTKFTKYFVTLINITLNIRWSTKITIT